MTTEELFADLKQFIEATVSQQTAHLEQRIDALEAVAATKEDLVALEQRLDEKLDTVHEAVAETAQDHERRLQHLEHRAV